MMMMMMMMMMIIIIVIIMRSALVCLRGSRSRRRTIPNKQVSDLELEVSVACR